jgi:hypothetical protein
MYQPMTWQLVILRDSDGRVHLGALVAGTTAKPAEHVELLRPVDAHPIDAGTQGQLRTDVVVRGEQMDDLQDLVERSSTTNASARGSPKCSSSSSCRTCQGLAFRTQLESVTAAGGTERSPHTIVRSDPSILAELLALHAIGDRVLDAFWGHAAYGKPATGWSISADVP